MILIRLMLMPTITILVDPLPVMVDAHVVSKFVSHDQSATAQASSLGYCARCLSFRLIEGASIEGSVGILYLYWYFMYICVW